MGLTDKADYYTPLIIFRKEYLSSCAHVLLFVLIQFCHEFMKINNCGYFIIISILLLLTFCILHFSSIAVCFTKKLLKIYKYIFHVVHFL